MICINKSRMNFVSSVYGLYSAIIYSVVKPCKIIEYFINNSVNKPVLISFYFSSICLPDSYMFWLVVNFP